MNNLNYLVKDETALILLRENSEIQQLLKELNKVNLVFNRVKGLESIRSNNYEWTIFPFLASDGRYIVSLNDKNSSYLYSCAEKSEELELRDQVNILLKQIPRKIEAKQSWVWNLGDKSEHVHIRSAYFCTVVIKIILQKIREGRITDLSTGSLGLLTEYPKQESQLKSDYQTIKTKLQAIDWDQLKSALANNSTIITQVSKSPEDWAKEIRQHLEKVKSDWMAYLAGQKEDLILDLGWKDNQVRKDNTKKVMVWIEETLTNKDYLGLENKWANLNDDYDGSCYTYRLLLKNCQEASVVAKENNSLKPEEKEAVANYQSIKDRLEFVRKSLNIIMKEKILVKE